jgi:hypothetical protein
MTYNCLKDEIVEIMRYSLRCMVDELVDPIYDFDLRSYMNSMKEDYPNFRVQVDSPLSRESRKFETLERQINPSFRSIMETVSGVNVAFVDDCFIIDSGTGCALVLLNLFTKLPFVEFAITQDGSIVKSSSVMRTNVLTELAGTMTEEGLYPVCLK